MPKAPVLACLVALAVGACSNGANLGISSTSAFNVSLVAPAERVAAPQVAGESLRPGPRVEESLTQGKVAVVNFWGSWCGPCRREQPALEALWKEYGPRGVVFVGVNTRRDQRAAALAYMDEFAVTYPSIYDPASTVAHRFKVRVMPVTFVIDRHGKTAATLLGALRDEADLRTILDVEVAA